MRYTLQAASFGAQANALLRKSATYQKRNVRTNICLLSSPIFFCLLLLIIRILVNNVFLTGPDFEVRLPKRGTSGAVVDGQV